MGSPEADVVEPAIDPQGDGAAAVDDVVAHPGRVVGRPAGRGSPWVGLHRRPPASSGGQGAVRTLLVVVGDEDVEERLELGDRRWLDRLGPQPLLHRLLESFDLATGGGVVGPGVLLADPEADELGLEPVAAALPTGETGGENHARFEAFIRFWGGI